MEDRPLPTDMTRMMVYWLTVALLLAGAGQGFAGVELDSNTAIFEGATHTYLFSPPPGFRLETDSSAYDGYSFAFIPDSAEYSSSPVTVGINIFRLENAQVDDVIDADTAAIRSHYGHDLIIDPIDPPKMPVSLPTRMFYLNNMDRFIPNVMVAYIDGGTELIVVELTIAPAQLRTMAETAFLSCVEQLRTLKHGHLDR